MLWRSVVIAVLLALASCSRATPTYFGNGLPGYVVTCDDLSGTFDRCFRQAGRVCGRLGYALYDWQGYPVSTAVAIRPVAFEDELEHKLLVACRA